MFYCPYCNRTMRVRSDTLVVCDCEEFLDQSMLDRQEYRNRIKALHAKENEFSLDNRLRRKKSHYRKVT